MPKIKFSALVSGMSGKANGSVFASNNGGAYFRTNASKIKPKTSSASVQKSLFSSVAQSWKSLTSDQQRSWNDSTAAFTTVNPFGDIRVPSGYEVFVKLNATRATQRLPVLVNPPVPRDLPAVGEVELEFPEFFQFMPTFAINNYSKNDRNTIVPIINPTFSSGLTINGNKVISASFFVDQKTESLQAILAERNIMLLRGTSSDLITVDLFESNRTSAKIRIQISMAAGVSILETDVQCFDFRKPNTISIFMASTDAKDWKIYVNGKNESFSKEDTGTYSTMLFGDGISLGGRNTLIKQHTAISDVRWYTEEQSADRMEMISRGYIIGTETYCWPFNNELGYPTLENLTPNATTPFEIEESLASAGFLTTFDSARVPAMALTVENSGMDGLKLNIFATAPISFGKIGKINNFKMISSPAWNGLTAFDVTEAWQAMYGSFIPEGYPNFQVQVIDETTGVASPLMLKPKKRTRFKAGAELSGAVN